MIHRALSISIVVAAALVANAPAADYRGMPAGWPNQTTGNYAGYAPASGGVYYAARPVTVAYANPAYLAAYGGGQTAYRPTVAATGYYQQPAATYYAPAYAGRPAAAYYPSQTAHYPPQTAYYAPQQVQYAPSQSYAISPAGGVSAGSEAAAYYGQPTTLNYVPPQFTYRTNYAQVPVYMYRPMTAYDPVVGQPTTCMQPQVASTCQPQRSRSWFSWLHPHNWFGGRSSGGCGSPPPTTAYCTTNYCQPPCGTQPYYPVPQQPMIIPGAPATQPGIPLTPIMPGAAPGSTYIPPATPRVPSPPTRIIPGTGAGGAADFNPRLVPGSIPPGSTLPGNPAPLPGSTTPLPGGTTPFLPSTPSLQPSAPGSFGTGTGYAPSSDPYQGNSAAPNTTIFGSGYRGSTNSPTSEPPATKSEGPVIRAPELNSPVVPPSVQPVPDLDARQPAAPLNRAPQLLSPRDKTAFQGDRRWAVVPAVWPKTKPAAASLPQRQVVQTKATEPVAVKPVPSPKRYDDSGWSSGRSW